MGNWNQNINVLERLTPFIGEGRLFCCYSVILEEEEIPSFARVAVSSSGVGSVDDMLMKGWSLPDFGFS